MIQGKYDKTATVTRLAYTSGKGTYSTVATITGHLQQASANIQQQTAQMYTISHLFWTDTTANVNVNDKITIDTVDYSVKGIQMNDYGQNKHKELHIEKV